MIADALARIQALEQQLTEKTQPQLKARLTIRACLKELREIRGPSHPNDWDTAPAHTISIVGR
jgi:hypothetical protein